MKMTAVSVIMVICLCVLIGCAEEENLSFPNTPPETHIAIADSIQNPTIYIQTIYWWGEDADGEVVGFEYRVITDPMEPGCPADSDWVFTEEGSRDFNLPVTHGMSTHRIEVRAVDDDGAVDLSPSSVTLPVTNSAPEIMIWNKTALPDTTFPTLRIKWHADDPEGQETLENYVVWLDGDEANARVLAKDDTITTFTLDDFSGRYGERTIYLVAVDSGCDTSDVVTHTWYVKERIGEVLLVDHLSSNYIGEPVTDQFYRDALDACVGTYSVLDLESFIGPRIGCEYPCAPAYSFDFEDLFELYDMVIWYDEPPRQDTTYLAAAARCVEAYVDAGGRFLLTSVQAIGNNSAFNDSIAFEIFGIDSLYNRKGNTNFDCKSKWPVTGNVDEGLGDLKVVGFWPGVECMDAGAETTPLFHIPPATVDDKQLTDYYIGIMNSRGAGKAALLTFPISRCNGNGNAASEICKIIDLLSE
jgi:hypothetical protein